jgi:hypothetical protein
MDSRDLEVRCTVMHVTYMGCIRWRDTSFRVRVFDHAIGVPFFLVCLC